MKKHSHKWIYPYEEGHCSFERCTEPYDNGGYRICTIKGCGAKEVNRYSVANGEHWVKLCDRVRIDPK